jgi:hypothetical protein
MVLQNNAYGVTSNAGLDGVGSLPRQLDRHRPWHRCEALAQRTGDRGLRGLLGNYCVTVLLKCCYGVVTLLLNCCYTVVTLLFH